MRGGKDKFRGDGEDGKSEVVPYLINLNCLSR